LISKDLNQNFAKFAIDIVKQIDIILYDRSHFLYFF